MIPMILMIPPNTRWKQLSKFRERLVVVVFGDTRDDFYDDDDGCIVVSFYVYEDWTRPNEHLAPIKRRRHLSSHFATDYGHHECFNRD